MNILFLTITIKYNAKQMGTQQQTPFLGIQIRRENVTGAFETFDLKCNVGESIIERNNKLKKVPRSV